ncbi:FmdB family transcriptional regulator [Paenarthrobacter sp. Z7-10]|nr:FmdB family transcriptional regulator [Paenarthrobacter sp. Z7-10]
MPTYAYACKDCDHAFDIQQSFSDNSLTVCPECDGALRKKFNTVGVVFKGPGFYRTDSRESKSSAGSTIAAAKDGSGKSAPANPGAGKGSEAGTSSSGPSSSGSSGTPSSSASSSSGSSSSASSSNGSSSGSGSGRSAGARSSKAAAAAK